nr:IAA9 [Galium aparine]
MQPSTSEKSIESPEYSVPMAGVSYFEETELRLCLPGSTSASKKRAFSEESVNLTLGYSSTQYPKFLEEDPSSENEVSIGSNKPPAKAQIVGWPPVKSSRKKNMEEMKKAGKYVKVAADGTPYLRKVGLEMYNGYAQLVAALEDMFTCLNICHGNNNKNGIQYVPTYEDKDGDWMLVGDVPWKMFVGSCKRIRLIMKSSEETDRFRK